MPMVPRLASRDRAVKMLAASRGSSIATPADTWCSVCSPPRWAWAAQVMKGTQSGRRKCRAEMPTSRAMISITDFFRKRKMQHYQAPLRARTDANLHIFTVKMHRETHVLLRRIYQDSSTTAMCWPKISVSAPPPMYCLLSTASTLLASTTANSAYYQNKSHNAFLSFKISQSVLILRPWSSCLFSFPRYQNKTSA